MFRRWADILELWMSLVGRKGVFLVVCLKLGFFEIVVVGDCEFFVGVED